MNAPKLRGLHIIGDLSGCRLDAFVRDREHLAALQVRLSRLVAGLGLHEVASCYHYFGPHAVTASLCLAESHLNFHTWPEFSAVFLDVFVCNQANNNSEAARRLFKQLAQEYFLAAHVRTQEFQR